MTTPFPKETTFITFGNISDYAPGPDGRVVLNATGTFRTTVTSDSPTASGWGAESAYPGNSSVLQYEDPDNPGTFIKMWDASTLTSTEPDAIEFYDVAGADFVRNSESYYDKKDAGTL